VCQDEYTAISNSGERYHANSSAISLQDYTEEYNTIRMTHEPQNHTSEPSNNITSESVGIYSSTVTSSPLNNETSTGRNLSLLPTFPSYFNNREGKTHRHLNHKPNRSHSIDIHTTMTEPVHSHSNQTMISPTNYHHNF
jgi:hypothetical protein